MIDILSKHEIMEIVADLANDGNEVRAKLNRARYLLEKVQRLVRDARVLRATNEELKGFRVHLVEEEWDAIVGAINE